MEELAGVGEHVNVGENEGKEAENGALILVRSARTVQTQVLTYGTSGRRRFGYISVRCQF